MADEFHQADMDDHQIDRAWDEELRRDDWGELHDFDSRVDDWEAAWRADKRRQAEAAERLLKGDDADEWPRYW